ncbi:hypothetical protein NEUTE1DRAFT_18829, partial [Neurospora tetrasperma FGSC 2508]
MSGFLAMPSTAQCSLTPSGRSAPIPCAAAATGVNGGDGIAQGSEYVVWHPNQIV